MTRKNMLKSAAMTMQIHFYPPIVTSHDNIPGSNKHSSQLDTEYYLKAFEIYLSLYNILYYWKGNQVRAGPCSMSKPHFQTSNRSHQYTVTELFFRKSCTTTSENNYILKNHLLTQDNITQHYTP